MGSARQVALACAGIVAVVVVTDPSARRVLGLPWPFTASWLALVAAATLGLFVGSQPRFRPYRVTTVAAGSALATLAAVTVYLVVRLVAHLGLGEPHPEVVAVPIVFVACTLFGRWRSRPIGPRDVLIAVAISLFALTDLRQFGTHPLRDFDIYVRAGQDFVAGAPVYISAPLTTLPSASELPFLYPPLTLPMFALLALLPGPVSAALWLGALGGASVLAWRVIGIEWKWLPILLLWPPCFTGIWSGNVAPIAFMLFALGPISVAFLILGVTFKLHNGIPALWGLRERRWREITVGVALLGVLGLATLPLVGIGAWRDWILSLGYFGATAQAYPTVISHALWRFLPAAIVVALSIAAVVIGLWRSGTPGLARLGVASVVASPSLYVHGLMVLVPGLLELPATFCWFALSVAALGIWGPWLAVICAVIGLLVPAIPAARPPHDRYHPSGSLSAWPGYRSTRDPGADARREEPAENA
jgi:hypothetical protein